jgi:nucleoside-diphosphate-sugar epimerase
VNIITMADTVLIIGASGQIGTELLVALRAERGNNKVIASDIRKPDNPVFEEGPFELLDVLDKDQLISIVKKHAIKEIYLLAALLSATAEKNPLFAWQLNMDGLFNVLNLAKNGLINKIFWPSSIAVFGPTSPRINTPQYTSMEPSTVYGISKQAGEQWCNYYHSKYGVDVRSIRYPGLIGYNSPPGGGTTDYAVDIFYKAKHEGKYTCFLSSDAGLPMMYMPDAIKATLQLMNAPAERLTARTSYNLGGISFTPAEIAAEIKKHLPSFEITYKPDFRDAIAKSWPTSIDDSLAQKDWDWKNQYTLESMVTDMLKNIKSA